MWVDRDWRPAPRWRGWTMLATYASTGLVLVWDAVNWYACKTKEPDGNLPLLSMVLPLLPAAFMLVKVESWGLMKVWEGHGSQPSPGRTKVHQNPVKAPRGRAMHPQA